MYVDIVISNIFKLNKQFFFSFLFYKKYILDYISVEFINKRFISFCK